MESKKADSISATEALAIYQQGGHVTCPSCGTVLTTIPANLDAGSRPLGLRCPVSHKHYFVYVEDAETMRAAREGLRRIAAKSDKSG